MYAESNDIITFDLEWHWKVKFKVTHIRSLISCKGAELRHMLLLNIDRKAYMGSQMTLSHLTLSDIERSNSRSLRFWSLISCKRDRRYVAMKQVCKKLPFVTPIAHVKQSAKVHGPLVFLCNENSQDRTALLPVDRHAHQGNWWFQIWHRCNIRPAFDKITICINDMNASRCKV